MKRWQTLAWLLALGTMGLMALATPPLSAQQTQPDQSESAEDATPEAFQKLVDAFMDNDMDDMVTLLRDAKRVTSKLTPKQRKELMYINRNWKDIKPDWWESTASSKPVAFPAEIWAKRFKADYLPSAYLGAQIPVMYDPYTNRIRVIVTWHPDGIDSNEKVDGKLAKRHDIRMRHMAECIVWHELGHNYISNSIPAQQAIDLYRNHEQLYHRAQEFYADMTALRHGSPKAMLTQLFIRTNELDRYDRLIPHTRPAHAVGSVLLVEFMNNPDKWPMVRFPSEVPEKDVELYTIRYVYHNLDPDAWDVTQYNQLRTYVDNWIRRGGRGDAVLKQKGKVQLDNRLLMYFDSEKDRQWQEKRDRWVANKLKQLIKSGRADSKERDPDDKWNREPRGGLFKAAIKT